MLTVLAILLWLVVGLLVLVLIIICVPVHLAMTIGTEPKPGFTVELRLVHARAPRLFRIDTRRARKPEKQLEKAQKPKPEKRKSKKRKTKSRWLGRPGPELVRSLLSVIRQTLAGIHFDRLNISAEFGLGDPAETGRVYGQIAALAYCPVGRVISINLTPNFHKVCFAGDVDAALHFTPIRLALPALRFGAREYLRRP